MMNIDNQREYIESLFSQLMERAEEGDTTEVYAISEELISAIYELRLHVGVVMDSTHSSWNTQMGSYTKLEDVL